MEDSIEKKESFFHSPAFGGVLLFVASVIAFVWANVSPHSYHDFWHTIIWYAGVDVDGLWGMNLHHVVNEFFMAIFFFYTGLEIKREVTAGHLSSFKSSILPFGAAIGGMVIPALFYYFSNSGLPTETGWGVPMATDIAFSLGVLALLGTRIPVSLKIFLTALAIVDDLGAVLVIAIYYTEEISFMHLLIGMSGLLFLLVANLMGVRNKYFYLIVGIIAVWISFVESGVHATIAGVLLAFVVPAKPAITRNEYVLTARGYLNNLEKITCLPQKGVQDSVLIDTIYDFRKLNNKIVNPSQFSEKVLHPIVAFFIMPIFALANAGVEIKGNFFNMLMEPVAIGIVLGLMVGKPLGVFLVTRIMVLFGFGELSKEVNWWQILGVGFLAGMGFTMSLFVTDLAFSDSSIQIISKTMIIASSLLSGLIGFVILYFSSEKKHKIT